MEATLPAPAFEGPPPPPPPPPKLKTREESTDGRRGRYTLAASCSFRSSSSSDLAFATISTGAADGATRRRRFCKQ